MRLDGFIDMAPMLTKERKSEHWKTRKKGVFTDGTGSWHRSFRSYWLKQPMEEMCHLGEKNVTLQITAGRKLPLGLHLLRNVILGHSAVKDSSSPWVTRGKARFSLPLPGGLMVMGRNHARLGSSDRLSRPRKS